MFERIRIRIPVLIKYGVRIPIFGRKSSEFLYLKNKARIPVFEIIRLDSTFWKDKFRIPMLIKIGQEFPCLEGQN